GDQHRIALCEREHVHAELEPARAAGKRRHHAHAFERRHRADEPIRLPDGIDAALFAQIDPAPEPARVGERKGGDPHADADGHVNSSIRRVTSNKWWARPLRGLSPPYSVKPPSTTMVWPVTMAAPKPRKTMTSAMSSGVQRRLSTAPSADARCCSSVHSTIQLESTEPGATALTRTSGPTARARFWVRLTTPALVAE